MLACAIAWVVCLADWIWFSRFALPPALEIARAAVRWLVFGGALVVAAVFVTKVWRSERRWSARFFAAITVALLPLWQFSVFASDAAGLDWLRVQCAQTGTGVAFVVGLCWVLWGLEHSSRRYEDSRLAEAAISGGSSGGLVWNPLDLDAWYYRLSFADWFNPRRMNRILNELRTRGDARYGEDNRKLNQSLAGFCSYTVAFLLAFILMTRVGGCGEAYEMPAGGGQQAQLAQQVKVQKVIKKKFVVNPFSAIKFKVPPIDDIKLQLTEITKHAYTVGYGEGTGAGFAGGTAKGKVRFIRLEYTGGDWDQDFGVGADLNMLVQYSTRTSQKVANETESRRIAELAAFPRGKSPPFVFMTGQRNISLAPNEVKTLRDYITDKHGMLFCDNGGSGHFHNQFFAMMNQVLPNVRPVPIPLDDVIHRIPYQIPFLPYVAPHGGREAWGWKIDGRWVAYYHPGDIGDAWSDGHSGVNPEVWEACYQLGTNVIFYAHTEYAKWLEAQQQSKGK